MYVLNLCSPEEAAAAVSACFHRHLFEPPLVLAPVVNLVDVDRSIDNPWWLPLEPDARFVLARQVGQNWSAWSRDVGLDVQRGRRLALVLPCKRLQRDLVRGIRLWKERSFCELT